MSSQLKRKVPLESRQAETSTIILEQPALKKLRLVHKGKVGILENTLQSSNSPQDALDSLLAWESTFSSNDQVQLAVPILIEHVRKERDSFVRAKIVAILGNVVCRYGNLKKLINQFLELLRKETSGKVQSQLLESILKACEINKEFVEECLSVAKEYLQKTNHLVRQKCLKIIGMLGYTEDANSKNSCQKLLVSFVNDRDDRVKVAAIQNMLHWNVRLQSLQFNWYEEICSSLESDNEGVRYYSLGLLSAIAQRTPNQIVTVRKDEIRLVDDAFSKICNMVNDVKMRVRAQAARLLGDMKDVDPAYLMQTLDKKLISNMRRKLSAHERQKLLYTSEWSSGTKWADDAPREEVDPQTFSLISSGACGAFIHALEDEFSDVRTAAIESIVTLASQAPAFACRCQDFLVDMFNDEIDTVRLLAINSVSTISKHVTLGEDQLDTMIGVLKESSYYIRDALQNMFCCVTLGSKACVETCIKGLIDNLQRYPQDCKSIWNCLKNLGRLHGSMIMPIVSQFIGIHSYLDIPEPNMDDPVYVGQLIMILNSCHQCQTLMSSLPNYVFSHYRYLRSSLPNFVPELTGLGVEIKRSVSINSNEEAFIQLCLQRLSMITSVSQRNADRLVSLTLADLQRLGDTSSSLKAKAECLSIYLRCQLTLHKMIARITEKLSIDEMKSLQQQAGLVLQLCQQAASLFDGLEDGDNLMIFQIKLASEAVDILTQLGDQSCKSKRIQLLLSLSALNNSKFNFSDCRLLKVLAANTERLENLDASSYGRVLREALKSYEPSILSLKSPVTKVRAEWIQPARESDAILKFTAGLPLGFTIVLDLFNITEADRIRLIVKFPNQNQHISIPRRSDIRFVNETTHRLATKVLMTHSVWSKPTHVEVMVGLCANTQHLFKKSSGNFESSILPICKPLKVLIQPKSSNPRRG